MVYKPSNKYLSITYAAKYSAYNSDYLTQLCRKNTLNCRQVSKVWFVELDSLSRYLQSNKKSTNNLMGYSNLDNTIVEIYEEMTGEPVFVIGTKPYITSEQLAKMSGYNKDYLTQLARKNEIKAVKLGKVWFFEKKFAQLWVKKSKTNKNMREKRAQLPEKIEQIGYISEKLTEDIPQLNHTEKRSVPIKRVNKKLHIHNYISQQQSNYGDGKDVATTRAIKTTAVRKRLGYIDVNKTSTNMGDKAPDKHIKSGGIKTHNRQYKITEPRALVAQKLVSDTYLLQTIDITVNTQDKNKFYLGYLGLPTTLYSEVLYITTLLLLLFTLVGIMLINLIYYNIIPEPANFIHL